MERGKKILAILTGLALMFVSMYFSNLGFGFGMDDKNLGTIGVVLAIAITVIELVFNGQLQYNKQNFTIYAIGLFAYLYGISTNVMGFWSAQHVVINSLSDIGTMRAIFGLLLGLFLEIAPEPLIVYGLIGISDTEGDMIGALLNTFGRTPTHSQSQQNYRPQQSTYQNIPQQQQNNKGQKNGRQQPPRPDQLRPSQIFNGQQRLTQRINEFENEERNMTKEDYVQRAREAQNFLNSNKRR
jgi:hypothetical protein